MKDKKNDIECSKSSSLRRLFYFFGPLEDTEPTGGLIMGLLKDLESKILIADGAMGTLLYSYGTDCCFEQLNLSHPEQIQSIHQAYIQAGANVIQTNTYSANYIKLQRYGLEEQVKELNSAAVSLAKKAAGGNAYVLGTIGGIRGTGPSSLSLEEIKRSFREQLYCLLLEGVDGLLLETFYDLEELEAVLKIARSQTDLPIISQISLQEVGILNDRTPVNTAIKRLEELGSDVVGLNCRLGPFHMIKTLEEVEIPKHAFLSAYPNASLPSYADGKFQYEGDAEYFKNSASLFRNQGVRLLGGCCGTTPAHIEAFAKELNGLSPVTEKMFGSGQSRLLLHHPGKSLKSLCRKYCRNADRSLWSSTLPENWIRRDFSKAPKPSRKQAQMRLRWQTTLWHRQEFATPLCHLLQKRRPVPSPSSTWPAVTGTSSVCSPI